MGRKEFLKQLWKFFFKPLAGLFIIYFCIVFLIGVFKDNGPERVFTVLLFLAAIFTVLASLAANLIKRTKDFLYAGLSAKMRAKIIQTGEILDYLIVMGTGIFLYLMWQKDWVLASFFILYILVQRIMEVGKNRK